MSYPPSGSTALSAPGKVLLTGGYLVLDRNYTGTVIALDARIHVIVQQLKRGHRRGASFCSVKGGPDTETVEDGSAVDDKEKEDVVVVRSPQFVNAIWEYGIQRCENGGGIKVIQRNDG